MKDFPLEKIKDSQGKTQTYLVQRLPDICPCCHNAIEPKYITGFVRDNEYPTVKNLYIQAIFQCPRRVCHRFFIADYLQWNEGPTRHRIGHVSIELIDQSPYWYKKRKFQETIEKVSPSFCKIFNQSAEAESIKLHEVAGPGYRKALEFLIKDFLIAEEPSKSASIKEMALQNLIQNKVQDPNLKACAARATWLGNDETHYLRIWKDKDIEDVKTLITLSVNWIDSHIRTKAYEKSMPDPKKAKPSKGSASKNP